MNITCCYRTSSFGTDFFEYLDDPFIQAEDFSTFMWVGFSSRIKFLSDITTVYRVNKNSITNSHTQNEKLSFVSSHVYARDKFVGVKNYFPEDWEEMQESFQRMILVYSFKNFLRSEHAKRAYYTLRRGHKSTFNDSLMFCGTKNIAANRFLRLFFYFKTRLFNSKDL
jgi:hypothetical protein